MRYFTPALPFFAILAAAAWKKLGTSNILDKRKCIFILSLPVLLLLLFIPESYYRVLLFNTLLSGTVRVLFYTSIIAALLVLIRPANSTFLILGKSVMAVAFAMAFINGYLHDFKIGLANRTLEKSQRVACSEIGQDSLVISTLPRRYYCHLLSSNGALAAFDGVFTELDTNLIDNHLRLNIPVYTDASSISDIRKDANAARYLFIPHTTQHAYLYEIEFTDSSL